MATDLKNASETPTTAVVGEIIRDAQELFSQQLAMFRAEFREDMRKTQQAVASMACGVVTAFVGAVLLSLMLVHLIHLAITDMPLWGAYGIVGLALAVIGGGIYYAGQKRWESNNPLPDKSAQALKENVQWLSQPK